MKLLHLADLHLGKVVNQISMTQDQRVILEEVLEICKERAVDTLLIAGDVYDKSIPTEEAVNLLDWFLGELAARKLPTFVISGNHDSDDRLNFGSSLMTKQGIYITGRYQGELPKVTLEDEHGPVHIYMLPFVKASVVAHYLAPEEGEEKQRITSSYEEAVRTVMERASINTAERNVLLAHQVVTGEGQDPETSGSEMATLNVGTIEKIGASVFSLFDYTALGHIHGPQRVGAENVRYAGSPMCYSLKEIGQNKSATLVTLGEKGEYSYELIPLSPPHPMIHLKGRFQEILDQCNPKNQDNYVYATLTDPDIIPDAMSTLRKYYPNAMKLDYAVSAEAAFDEELVEDAQEMSFTDLMSAFFEQSLGHEPNDEQWEILQEVAKEAGVVE